MNTGIQKDAVRKEATMQQTMDPERLASAVGRVLKLLPNQEEPCGLVLCTAHMQAGVCAAGNDPANCEIAIKHAPSAKS